MPSNSKSFDHAGKVEANGGDTSQLERLQTDGGHPNDRTQPSLPVVHRRFANPAPLGLLSFATGKLFKSVSEYSGDTNGIRNFPDFNLWSQNPRHRYSECFNRCSNLFRRGVPIYLWYHGICERQHGASLSFKLP